MHCFTWNNAGNRAGWLCHEKYLLRFWSEGGAANTFASAMK
jgi:hypothetical protein